MKADEMPCEICGRPMQKTAPGRWECAEGCDVVEAVQPAKLPPPGPLESDAGEGEG